MATLIFIDTNILLDFYRGQTGGTVDKTLKFIDENHSTIITSDQVRMEFMKHRQNVIKKTIGEMKKPDGLIRQMPPLLVEAKPAEKIKKHFDEITKDQTAIKKRIEKILLQPIKHDKVYQCAQRLFKDSTALNLSREKTIRFSIRRLAYKRFFLGYPPKKAEDLGVGDALNWEWIIHCAKAANSDVLIVSRDGDYGMNYEGKTYINDWLAEEFKSRVSRKRKVTLTPRLTDALEIKHVAVTAKEREEEQKLVDAWSIETLDGRSLTSIDFDKYISEMVKQLQSGIGEAPAKK